MPEFDANEDLTRLPGQRPEGSEEPTDMQPPPAARGGGLAGGRRRAARRRGEGRVAGTMRARRRATRLACGPARKASGRPPGRCRARCGWHRKSPGSPS